MQLQQTIGQMFPLLHGLEPEGSTRSSSPGARCPHFLGARVPDPLRSSAPSWGWRSAAIPLLFLLCPSLLLSGSACPSGRQKAEEFGIFSGFQEEVLVVVPTGLVQAFQVSQL